MAKETTPNVQEEIASVWFPEFDVENVDDQDDNKQTTNDTTEEVDEAVEQTEVVDEAAEVDDPPQTDDPVEEPEVTEEGNEESDETDDQINPNIQAHFDYMKENGYLVTNEDFKFDGTNIEEAYAQDAQIRTNQIAQQLINGFPEQGREFLDYMIKGGQDLEGFFKLHEEEKSFESYDVSDVEQAKAVIKRDLVDKGLSESAIKYTIESYEIGEVLTTEAEKIKTARVNAAKQAKETKTAQEVKAQEQARQEQQEYFDQAVNYLSESNWSKAKQKEVIDSLFVPQANGSTKVQQTIMQIFQSPKAAAILTDIILGYDSRKDEWSFKRIEDSLKTKVTKRVKKSFDKYLNSTDSAASIKSENSGEDKNKPFDWSKVELVTS